MTEPRDCLLPPASSTSGEPDDGVPFDLDAGHDPAAVALDDDEPHLLKDAEDEDRWAWRAKLRDNPVTLFWWRIAVGVAGLLCMIAAALTGWLPGPGGIPLFLLGLAIWASEFDWAHGVLMYFKGVYEWLLQATVRQRIVFWSCFFGVIWIFWYLTALFTGVPDWMPEPVRSWLRMLPGLG